MNFNFVKFLYPKVIVYPKVPPIVREDLWDRTREKCLEFWAINGPVGRQIKRSLTHVCWGKPPPNTIKLNMDGAALPNPGRAAGGGVFRDSSGCWISGFCRNIGFASSLEAELWALRDGLSIAVEKQVPNLEVEIDCSVALNLFHFKELCSSHFLFSLVSDCRNLASMIPRCSIKHIFREGNGVADCLSKFGLKTGHGLHLLDLPPPSASFFIFSDIAGSCFPRLVCN